MGSTIKFDYYYGIEAEQFSFYRVPRPLIKDERFEGLAATLSSFRDRCLTVRYFMKMAGLMMKTGVYLVDSIKEALGCGKDKAIKVLPN